MRWDYQALDPDERGYRVEETPAESVQEAVRSVEGMINRHEVGHPYVRVVESGVPVPLAMVCRDKWRVECK